MRSTREIENFLESEARAHKALDDMVNSRTEKAHELMVNLLHSREVRNESIYELLGADVDKTLDDYGAVEVLERGPEWSIGVAAQVAAAKAQVWVDIYGIDMIELIEKYSEEIESAARRLDRKALKEAARLGIGKDRIDG